MTPYATIENMNALVLEFPHQFGYPLGLRHKISRTGQLGHRLFRSILVPDQQVFGVKDPDYIIQAFLVNRDARMPFAADEGDNREAQV